MRYLKFKKSPLLFLHIAMTVFAGALISSCDKGQIFDQLGDDGPKIIGIMEYGGSDGFAKSSLTFNTSLPLDSIHVRMLYTGAGTFDKDVVITLGTDPNALTAYNASVPAGGIKYTLMPATIYSLPKTTVVMKKGNTMSEEFTVLFYPDQIDLAVSYMLPLTITGISGAPSDVSKASGTGTALLHIIGNPLAGAYDVEGYFYHPSLPRAFVRPDVANGLDGSLIPVSDKALVTELGDLGTSGYYAVINIPDPFASTIQPVTITVYPGSIDPVYQWDTGLPTTNPGYTSGWAKSALCNNTYDPATKTFYLRYGYLGGTGYRVTEEVIKKH